jgi:hypothetical protein
VTVLFRRPWLGVAGAVAAVLVAAAGLLAFRSMQSPSGGSLDVVTRLDFRCTLPVVLDGRLATVSIPDGAVAGSAATIGKHDQGDSYFGGRWLPVQAAWVSPDGGSYAYITWSSGAGTETSTLFVHDVARGSDRALWTGPGQALLDVWTAGGIYLNLLSSTGPGSRLWVVDPARPAGAHAVGPNPPQAGPHPTLFGQVVGGAAWTIAASREPAAGSSVVVNDELVRMDLRSGSLTTWFQAPAGLDIGLLAFDRAGRPLVGLAPASIEVENVIYPLPVRSLALVTGRGASRPVAMPDPDLEPDGGFADEHGIWLTGPGSLWLYRNGRLTKVAGVSARVAPPARQPAYPAGVPAPRRGAALHVAGPCT